MNNIEKVLDLYSNKLQKIEDFAKSEGICFGIWTLAFINEINYTLTHYANEESDDIPDTIKKIFMIIEKIGESFYSQITDFLFKLHWTPTLDMDGVIEILDAYIERYWDCNMEG